uniref:Taste receptor type 2 n=1 Tax=Gadus morhua TaxID=8049 RepID=A0A8C4ZU97_GADMO
MMISCFATAHYLNKHMKSLSASDGSLSSPRLHSQIRVTVAGILQGVLCFLCGIWNLVYVMIYYLSPYFYFGSNITFTVVNLYISGTTVNLGVGQTLFRERAIHVWKAVNKRLCTGNFHNCDFPDAWEHDHLCLADVLLLYHDRPVPASIKSIIYVVLLFDRFNGTEFFYIEIKIAFISIINIYMFLCLFVMMISCFAKAHYLNKHMKNLSVSDGSLSSPRLHSQIRVTVTGILQELLCFLCAMWIIVDVMSVYLSSYFFFDHYITFTVINLYILGSTVNLGVGQTLFRKRAVHIWKFPIL